MNTKHALDRAQQRGIPPLIQEWLCTYGLENYNGNGMIVRYFTNKSIRLMEREFGREPIRRLSEYFRCYLIESINGQVITMGKRYKRIKNY